MYTYHTICVFPIKAHPAVYIHTKRARCEERLFYNKYKKPYICTKKPLYINTSNLQNKHKKGISSKKPYN